MATIVHKCVLNWFSDLQNNETEWMMKHPSDIAGFGSNNNNNNNNNNNEL